MTERREEKEAASRRDGSSARDRSWHKPVLRALAAHKAEVGNIAFSEGNGLGS